MSVKRKRVSKPKKVKPVSDYRSHNEEWFVAYLNELKENGFVERWEYEPFSFILSPEISRELVTTEVKILKTKTKVVKKVKKIKLFHGHSYTPDFKIIFTPLAKDLFYVNEFDGGGLVALSNTGECWVEIKPQFDFQNSTRIAKLDVQWVYQVHKILINIVKPLTIFERTFTPKEYINYFKKSQAKSKIKNIKTLEEYVRGTKSRNS